MGCQRANHSRAIRGAAVPCGERPSVESVSFWFCWCTTAHNPARRLARLAGSFGNSRRPRLPGGSILEDNHRPGYRPDPARTPSSTHPSARIGALSCRNLSRSRPAKGAEGCFCPWGLGYWVAGGAEGCFCPWGLGFWIVRGAGRCFCPGWWGDCQGPDLTRGGVSGGG